MRFGNKNMLTRSVLHELLKLKLRVFARDYKVAMITFILFFLISTITDYYYCYYYYCFFQ